MYTKVKEAFNAEDPAGWKAVYQGVYDAGIQYASSLKLKCDGDDKLTASFHAGTECAGDASTSVEMEMGKCVTIQDTHLMFTANGMALTGAMVLSAAMSVSAIVF